MGQDAAKEFNETIKRSGEHLQSEIKRKGLDKDPVLVEKVKKIGEGCKEASEYLKTRIEK